MTDNLVIVESPAKAKTIEKFLGKDYTVVSSFGHIRDLSKKKSGIDIEKDFEPHYEVSAEKKAVVRELKKLAKEAKTVWLASDEDREGEAIAWHLAQELKLNSENTKRIVFHEITKPAITNAIKNPRDIDKNLVNAQQARRILDRIVGFELSPVLWRKVKPSLSAGRVQSVAVRLLVERERDIINFKTVSAFRVRADFTITGKNATIVAELTEKLKNESETEAFLETCKSAEFKILDIVKKPTKKTPSAPFTTSTLQQEASRKLGFSVSQTMSVAQRLYEAGKITYMRTDSVNLSDTAVQGAVKKISKDYGQDYVKSRRFQTKSKGAQEAHEAIRPTYLENETTEGSSQEKKLYDLIWKRTIASQMKEAEIERTVVTIAVGETNFKMQAVGEVLKFPGFIKVYQESSDEEEENTGTLLPPIQKTDNIELEKIIASERFTNHPPRYTEASLVKKLEELGIGRPSTYAPTISTILNRGYVVKENREGAERSYKEYLFKEGNITKKEKKEISGTEKNKLFPQDIGMVVTDFLVKNFEDILDYNFTAQVEKKFDDIAEGQVQWVNMLKDFYTSFHPKVEQTLEHSERDSGKRILGKDPKTGHTVSVKLGRFGPVAQIGEPEETEKPQFASLLRDQYIETISLEEVMDLFRLPRTVGDMEGKPITVAIGRFGPYVKHDNKFASLKKGQDDPYTISHDRAIELILEKREAESKKTIKEFKEDPELMLLNGRYGPYIKYKKKNFRIPKGKKPEELTYEACKEIISKSKKQ